MVNNATAQNSIKILMDLTNCDTNLLQITKSLASRRGVTADLIDYTDSFLCRGYGYIRGEVQLA